MITLIIGDWSNDGHGTTEKYLIESNLTKKDLLSAYKKGCGIIGFNLSKMVATEYMDNCISEAHLEKLTKFGFVNRRNDLKLDVCLFAEMWLFISKIGNPKFDWKCIPDNSTIDIGGYGLFE
jgi:hypothetical protein